MPFSKFALMSGMRFSTVIDSRKELSKVTGAPALLLTSTILTSAQFQNSSGEDDFDVQELVVM